MTYNYGEKKITAVLASNLEMGVALNVMGHLSMSLAAHADLAVLMGRDVLQDGSGVEHLGISKYPIVITKVRQGKLKKLITEVRNHEDLIMADFPEQMLSTAHDDELAQELQKATSENLNYLGAIIYGNAELVTTLTGRFELWR